ncbi:MAG TPA: MFS transporter [Candidatus Limnocylindrales bacterium]
MSGVTIAEQTPGVRADQAPHADPKRWLALIVIAVAQTMVVLDATIVNIAMPEATRVLGIDEANRQWILTAYTLSFGALLLLGGRIADYVGRKKVFIIGLLGFAAASALGGLAQNGATLFGARALQGAFGALLAPAALALITVTFTEVKDRAKAFGVFGAISGAGAAVGLILGGLLTQYADWRWCLLVLTPVAIVTALFARPIVRESKAEGNTKYDIPGTILATAGLFALVYGFVKAAPDEVTGESGWGKPETLTLFAVAAVLLIAFIFVEVRSKNPMLPMRVLLHRNRGGSYVVSVLLGAGMMGMFLFMTYYFQGTLGWSPLKAGLAYLPFSLAIIVTAGIGSTLLPKVGPLTMMATGGLLSTVALAWLSQLEADSPYSTMILPIFVLMAMGMGLIFLPLGNTALTGVSPHDAGVASATLNAAQQIGGSLGVALLNTVFITAATNFGKENPPASADPAAIAKAQLDASIHGYDMGFLVSAVLMAVGTVAILLFIRNTKDQMEQGHAPTAHLG